MLGDTEKQDDTGRISVLPSPVDHRPATTSRRKKKADHDSAGTGAADMAQAFGAATIDKPELPGGAP